MWAKTFNPHVNFTKKKVCHHRMDQMGSHIRFEFDFGDENGRWSLKGNKKKVCKTLNSRFLRKSAGFLLCLNNFYFFLSISSSFHCDFWFFNLKNFHGKFNCHNKSVVARHRRCWGSVFCEFKLNEKLCQYFFNLEWTLFVI